MKHNESQMPQVTQTHIQIHQNKTTDLLRKTLETKRKNITSQRKDNCLDSQITNNSLGVGEILQKYFCTDRGNIC